MLVATATGFVSTFRSAGSEVRTFADGFKHAAGIVAGAGAIIGGGEAVRGLVELTKHSFENIDATAKMSDSLGVSTESLSRLQYAASYSGTSIESLQAGILKMEKALGGADDEGGKAAEAFTKIGLNASDLIAMQPDQAMGKIADALQTIENPAQRNAAALAIFGKGAVDLLPLLAEGSEGLAKFGAEADKLGYSFNRVDAAKVEAANDAIQKMHNVLEGALNQLAIQMAPFVEAMANKLSDFATQGQGLSGILVSGFKAVVQAIASAADWLELAKAGFYLLEAAGLEAFSYLETAIAKVLNGLDWLQEKLGGKHEGWGDAYAAEAKTLEQSAVEAFNKAGESWDNFTNGTNQQKVTAFFDGIQASAQKAAQAAATTKNKLGGPVKELDDSVKNLDKIKAKLEDMQKEVDQFNMTKGEKEADDLKRLGATKEQQEQAKKLAEQLDYLEELKKAQEDMAKDAKKLWEDTATPLEKYNETIQKNQQLLDAGLIDQETFDRGQKKAEQDFYKDSGDKFEPPKLLTQGSAEAASFIAKIQAQTNGHDALKQQLDEARKSNEKLQQIVDNTKGGSGNLAVVSMA